MNTFYSLEKLDKPTKGTSGTLRWLVLESITDGTSNTFYFTTKAGAEKFIKERKKQLKEYE